MLETQQTIQDTARQMAQSLGQQTGYQATWSLTQAIEAIKPKSMSSYEVNMKFDEKYFIQSGGQDAVEAMLERERKDFQTRFDFLKICMKDRKLIMHEHLARIDNEECMIDTMLSAKSNTFGTHPSEISSLEKALFELNNQRRIERTNAWRDCWNLQKELLVLIKEGQEKDRMSEIMQ